MEGLISRPTQVSDDAQRMKTLVETTLRNHKADDIVVIDLAGKTDIADFMIIASGTSGRHVSSLADHVIKALKDAEFPAPTTEGQQQSDWVLVDGINVVVHLFRPEVRDFYNLEKMWQIPVLSEASV